MEVEAGIKVLNIPRVVMRGQHCTMGKLLGAGGHSF